MNYSILYIEDERGTSSAVIDFLTDAGFHVTLRETVEKGIALLEQPHNFNVVLMDNSTPGKNMGRDLVQRFWEEIPVVLHSGDPHKTFESLLAETNVVFLPKPAKPAKIIEAINSALSNGAPVRQPMPVGVHLEL